MFSPIILVHFYTFYPNFKRILSLILVPVRFFAAKKESIRLDAPLMSHILGYQKIIR